MKRILLIFQFLCLAIVAMADSSSSKHVETDDHVVFGELTLVSGTTNRYSLMVNLVGSRQYTAYEMDIEFPPGLDVEMKDSKPNLNIWRGAGTIYPYSEDEDSGDRTFTHHLVSSFGKIGKHKLRLSVYSDYNDNLTANSGPLFKLYLVASPYLKPGDATLKVTQCHLITYSYPNATQYDTHDHNGTVNVASRERSVNITVSAKNKYSTCVMPFDSQLPQGLRAFSIAKREGSTLYLDEQQYIKAFTPYILYAGNGYSGTLSGTVDETLYQETVQDGVLCGTLVDRDQEEGHVLQNKGDGAKFYAINGQDFIIPAGKCWVMLPSPIPTEYNAPLDMSIDGSATGVNGVWQTTDNAQTYSIDGTRVNKIMPGRIYIRNGRKFMKM